MTIGLSHYLKLMKKFCVGCGACIGICPKDAISVEVLYGFASIIIDTAKCINCGLCSKVCPVLPNLNLEFTLPKQISNVEVFIGYSTDTGIRYYGASGGIVTSVLSYLLEKGKVDGALVVKAQGREIIPYVAVSPEALRDAQGSIYFPTFSLKFVKKLKNRSSYAVVGLPCQIDALKKLIDIGVLPRDKVKYLLGLRCYHVNAPWYLDYMIKRMLRLPVGKIREVSARRYGWPGKVIVMSKAGNYVIPHFYDKRLGIGLWNPLALGNLNAQLGCLLCTNHENLNADITFGDAWLPMIINNDKIGTSLIVSRTEEGLELIRRVASEGYIIIQRIEKNAYAELTINGFKTFKQVLREIFKRGLLKTVQRYGVVSTLKVLPYLIIISPPVRRVLLNAIPPKILMDVIGIYIRYFMMQEVS